MFEPSGRIKRAPKGLDVKEHWKKNGEHIRHSSLGGANIKIQIPIATFRTLFVKITGIPIFSAFTTVSSLCMDIFKYRIILRTEGVSNNSMTFPI
jgi:hypothetical protein